MVRGTQQIRVIIMEHDERPIPRDDYWKYSPSAKTACYRCGLWNPSNHPSLTCDDMMDEVMSVYRDGGASDPFRGYRYDLCIVEESNEIETRPGLVQEVIDREAYDDFMRTL